MVSKVGNLRAPIPVSSLQSSKEVLIGNQGAGGPEDNRDNALVPRLDLPEDNLVNEGQTAGEAEPHQAEDNGPSNETASKEVERETMNCSIVMRKISCLTWYIKLFRAKNYPS